MLERDLRQVDIIGGDEGGIVGVDGIIDVGALLVAGEQPDHQVYHQEADRDDPEPPAERDRIVVGRPTGVGGGHCVRRAGASLSRGHFSAFPRFRLGSSARREYVDRVNARWITTNRLRGAWKARQNLAGSFAAWTIWRRLTSALIARNPLKTLA